MMKKDQNIYDKVTKGNLVIAADLGGTNLRAATVDIEGSIHQRVKLQTPGGEQASDIVQALVAAARECELHSCARGEKICAISVVVPGTVQIEDGVVTKAPNLPCLDGFRLSAALEDELQWPAILENDANAAAVGEMWRGVARGHKAIICLTLGTGVGGGIILDGKLWRGVDGAAGEIGHMTIEPSGVACPCGSRGCLEVYASATAIVRMALEASPQYHDSRLHLSDELTAEAVYHKGLEGDELALEVFRRMGSYLGIGLASLINVLNPEIIVIGGGLANGWELFDKHVRAQIAMSAFPIPAGRVRIVRAECGDDAGLLGAAQIAFTRLAVA